MNVLIVQQICNLTETSDQSLIVDMSIRDQVVEKVKELPKTATIADIREELDILEAIDSGIEDIEAGKSLPLSEVEKLLPEWVTK